MGKNILIGALLLVVGAGGACLFLVARRGSEGQTAARNMPADFCAKHQIAEKDCPWCDSSLIKSKGECPEHGVPEALCSRCNAALIPGFKAENDWCAGHAVPESQCAKCRAGDLPPDER